MSNSTIQIFLILVFNMELQKLKIVLRVVWYIQNYVPCVVQK